MIHIGDYWGSKYDYAVYQGNALPVPDRQGEELGHDLAPLPYYRAPHEPAQIIQ